MKNTLRIAGAYVGIIIGAGFASGQEIVQFFTSFGLWGIIGAVITIALFAFIGMQLIQLGSHLQVSSHKKVIRHICGKYLGPVVDITLTFFLFGVATIMVAGSGSIFEQQFGMSPLVGNILMVILSTLTLCLNTDKVISVISLISPYMLTLIIIITIYSFFTSNAELSELESTALAQPSAASHWLLSALLYVAFNIAVGFSMMTLIGSTAKDSKSAGRGAVLGGICLGVLVVLINLGIYANINRLQGIDMPTLLLASDISPVVGILMSIALLSMIFNTAVGMLYSFTARFVEADTPKFRGAVVVVGLLSFAASLVGFTDLVSTVYPLMGYLGFILIGGVTISWVRSKKQPAPVAAEE
ncbi:YkvI family membrane protein [Halobacillus naozhouensis]|uniref:Membrane protein YkvI n=1 Tax=Halobacillus naozhouensis TaxID=554880 RepID=A0ABY8J463_9BACI|nr:hypothetical protein [Halobacillus naozhouensis]WFT75746.1 hypothetical protein P9989_05005 [Halobacillus naozhouensis]